MTILLISPPYNILKTLTIIADIDKLNIKSKLNNKIAQG